MIVKGRFSRIDLRALRVVDLVRRMLDPAVKLCSACEGMRGMQRILVHRRMVDGGYASSQCERIIAVLHSIKVDGCLKGKVDDS